MSLDTTGELDGNTLDSTPSFGDIPPTMIDRNESVTNMFEIAPPPPKKGKKSKRCTTHRLLMITKSEILEEKKNVEEAKKQKELKKVNGLEIKKTEHCKEDHRRTNKRTA